METTKKRNPRKNTGGRKVKRAKGRAKVKGKMKTGRQREKGVARSGEKEMRKRKRKRKRRRRRTEGMEIVAWHRERPSGGGEAHLEKEGPRETKAHGRVSGRVRG